MESELSALYRRLKGVIDFFEGVVWGTGSNIYRNVFSAREDLDCLEGLPSSMLEVIYGVSKQLDKKLFKDMEAAFFSLANMYDSAAKNHACSTESETNSSYMEYATNTMRKAKEFLPVLRNLRSRLHQSLPVEELVSTIDKIIELVGHRHVSDLPGVLKSDEVQDLTARLIVQAGKHKLLDSNSLVWLYWGDCDWMQLCLYCEPESDYFDHFGESLCTELRILREKAKLLSSETESAENQAARNGSTCADLLESIHIVGRDLEKATAPDLDLDSLSQTEMAFADAAVIKYLTERFGEQDDALGNWPSDWHECPEAFELYKVKIKEYRASRAKVSLDEVQRIAEKEVVEAKAIVDTNTDIPPERRSAPLSLGRMAQYWGGEMTRKKLRYMIDKGTLKVIPLGRQSFIFDTKYLPQRVIEKVSK